MDNDENLDKLNDNQMAPITPPYNNDNNENIEGMEDNLEQSNYGNNEIIMPNTESSEHRKLNCQYTDSSLKESKLNKSQSKNAKSLIETLKSQIQRQKNIIDKKNKELDALENENNQIKLKLIEKHKEVLKMENEININNINTKQIKAKNTALMNENKEMEMKIKKLNYKIIEQDQKIISIENLQNVFKKLNENLAKEDLLFDKDNLEISSTNDDNNKNSTNNKANNNAFYSLKLEIEKKQMLLDEATIKNEKLVFENLINAKKLETMEEDKVNELKIKDEIFNNKIEYLHNYINCYENQIKKLIEEKNKEPNVDFGVDQLLEKTDILVQLSSLEQKLKNLDDENYKLKKKLSKKQNECEEKSLILENKEKVIQKLLGDIEALNNEYQDNNPQDKEEIIEDLNARLQNAMDINKKSNCEFQEVIDKINDANKLYINKMNNYETQISQQNEKLKEYKKKIVTLKIKIDELYIELNKEKSKNLSYLSNNNLLNSINNSNNINNFNPLNTWCNANTFILNPNNNNLNSIFGLDNNININNNSRSFLNHTPNKQFYNRNSNSSLGTNRLVNQQNMSNLNNKSNDKKNFKRNQSESQIRVIQNIDNNNNNININNNTNNKSNIIIGSANDALLGCCSKEEDENAKKLLEDYRNTLNKVDDDFKKFI